jgi:hypothetical protein
VLQGVVLACAMRSTLDDCNSTNSNKLIHNTLSKKIAILHGDNIKINSNPASLIQQSTFILKEDTSGDVEYN